MRKLIILAGLVVLFPVVGHCVSQPNNIGYSKTDSPFQLYSLPVASIEALVPDTTGQILHCSDCTKVPVCVSTGVLAGAWVSVGVSTQATTAFGNCQ